MRSTSCGRGNSFELSLTKTFTDTCIRPTQELCSTAALAIHAENKPNVNWMQLMGGTEYDASGVWVLL